MPTVQELQKQCKAMGLSTKGTKAQLTKRLEEKSGLCRESSVESEDGPMCGAVLATQVKISCEEDMKEDAKVALGLALDGELEVQEVRGTMYVGNRRGLDFADLQERFRMIEQRDAQRSAEIASLKQKDSTLQNQIDQLDDRLSTLTFALQEYKQVREMFIGAFRRDILKNATKRDYDIIKAGNITAHGGDIAADALLYEGVGGRHDSRTFIELYGLTPSDAQKIHHKETIAILNTHAKVRAGTKKKGSKEYYRRFQVFIEKFEQSDHDTNYLKAVPATDVTKAYGDLLSCKKYEDIAYKMVPGPDCVATLQ